MAVTTPLEIPQFPRRPGLLRVPAFDRLALALARNRFASLAAVFLLLIVAAAVLAPLVSPYDPNAQHVLDRLTPPFWQAGGSRDHLLGTDELGRDVLSRIIWGARTSLTIGIAVVAISVVVGTVTGLLAGYIGGWFDSVMMRIVDIQFSFPALLMAMAIVLVLGASARSLIIALSIDGWLVYCRLTRSMALSLRNTTFIEAAKSVGCTDARLLWRHALPNILSPIVTLGTLEFARIVLAESTLSFLGLGIQPPLVSWGLMLNNGEDYLTVAWWLITFPGLVLTLTVLSANVVASWLRVASDPLQRAGVK